MSFHHRGLECKSRKSRNTWSNRQIWTWSTKISKTKANRLLPRECTSHSKHPLSTTQEKTLHMDITRWLVPNFFFWKTHQKILFNFFKFYFYFILLYNTVIDCILCSQRWRSSIQSAKTRLGADCGSDHKLLIAKFRF